MNKFYKSIIAGASISLGVFIFLFTMVKTGNRLLASCTFYIGLALIFTLKTNLFTGKILSEPVGSNLYYTNLSIYWIGNLLGSIITTILLCQLFKFNVMDIIITKMNLSVVKTFISAMFCNVLVCSAVLNYNKTQNHFISWLFITLFVFCGFEHIVANFTYYTISIMNGYFDLRMITMLVVVTIGNFVGGRIVNYFNGECL